MGVYLSDTGTTKTCLASRANHACVLEIFDEYGLHSLELADVRTEACVEGFDFVWEVD